MEGQMPDLVPPIEDKSELYSECRKECAYNFPAMVIFVGSSNFVESLYSTFAGLASDPSAKVRKTLASSLHELAKLVGTSFNTTKVQIVQLFHGNYNTPNMSNKSKVNKSKVNKSKVNQSKANKSKVNKSKVNKSSEQV
jgi:uncharacterized protein YjbI with pentapeptide repeats